jgi:hypothetical protein
MVKILTNTLAVLGLIVLLVAIGGRLIGNPSLVYGLRVINVIIVANTLLLLAVLNKLILEK